MLNTSRLGWQHASHMTFPKAVIGILIQGMVGEQLPEIH